jgi:hypothetical protein
MDHIENTTPLLQCSCCHGTFVVTYFAVVAQQQVCMPQYEASMADIEVHDTSKVASDRCS